MISIIFLLIFIIILLLILIIKFKLTFNIIMVCLLSMFTLIFFININISINAIIDACNMCLYSIIPTIFPFAVISNLLMSYNGINLYSKLIGKPLCKLLSLSKGSTFPILVSFLCGYPLGSKFASEVYEKRYISKAEYIRLINIATNCGPLFIIGAVSATMLNNTTIGYYLLISNYVSVIVIAIFTRKKSKDDFNINTINTEKSISFGENFKNAIDSATKTTFTVIGFILIFSVIISILKNSMLFMTGINSIESLLKIPHNLLSSILFGFIEITSGIKLIVSINMTLSLKLAIISFLCSFSGLSIICQSLAFISKNKVSIIKFISLKFLQGIISFIITYIIFCNVSL